MKELQFNKDGKLKILQLTDLHYDGNCDDDKQTLALVRALIAAEKPDFIAITGDSVFGDNNNAELHEILAPVLEADVAWGYVFGNHDTERGSDKQTLYNTITKMKNCYMQNFDASIAGVGNYYIPVKSADGDTKWVLFMMDSLQYNADELVEGYAYFHRNQVNWYYDTATKLKETLGEHSALAFFHIALPEYDDVWDFHTCYGEKNEGICCPNQNSGMFSAMLEVGNMKGTFVGHDHINDFYGELYGIKLCFGRGTGYNTYGRDDFPHGARIIEISQDDLSGFKSWLRLDNGEVVLNQKEHFPELVRVK